VTFGQVQENTGFALLKAPDIAQTEPPRAEELRVLREEVDPYGYIVGR
jgi:glutaconate CoA-transferase subunit B